MFEVKRYQSPSGAEYWFVLPLGFAEMYQGDPDYSSAWGLLEGQVAWAYKNIEALKIDILDKMSYEISMGRDVAPWILAGRMASMIENVMGPSEIRDLASLVESFPNGVVPAPKFRGDRPAE